ncbi:hypothetical protein SAMN05877831_11815 [Rhodobacter maris]|uniref:Uncharacterized protein n=2 Tax=Rhodobacter maris TaxID=446682 RepID=A0A285TCA1_9RHOB|nr:hypothetical protein SAMN05877831_11815 [Rhodobacter maris]
MLIITPKAEHTRLKSYSATTKGTVSIVKIEVECTDLWEFNYLLQSLRELDTETKAMRAAKAAAAKQKSRKAEAQALLSLPASAKSLPLPKGGEA